MGKLENLILSTLDSSNEGLTLVEIAGRIEQSEKKVYKSLRKLFEKGKIDSENRRYRLTNH